jgi:hypothetical protein
MAIRPPIYSLDDINQIIFQGFNYELPNNILKVISELSLQVGSPDYVKTPVFKKRENIPKPENVEKEKDKEYLKKKKGNKHMEAVNDADWNSVRSFQLTKMEEKVGINAKIDTIRIHLNKLSDKNYIDIRNKIIAILDTVFIEYTDQEELMLISSIIFDIASTNRFYSKMYAELYAELITKYEIMKNTFEVNLSKFTALFDTIEYVEPNMNYDKFCENNKINEKRKSLAAFYVNLMENGIISTKTIKMITRNLLSQIYRFIDEDNKKNEVDELTENISILYKKDIYEDDEGEEYEKINGYTISEIIERIANSKGKNHKSLTIKTLFKFMDMIDM